MLTDVMLGSFIGGWTIWLQHGVVRKHDPVISPLTYIQWISLISPNS